MCLEFRRVLQHQDISFGVLRILTVINTVDGAEFAQWEQRDLGPSLRNYNSSIK